ncbi:MAG: replication and repair protein RecF [Verrucomicrobiota bacterium]|jgi:predicted ATPase
MIHKLAVKNFTVFRKAEFAFAKGINVVIGSNGAGKSHVLKLAYTAARWSHEMALREKQIRPDKATLQKELGKKLMGVFRCEGVGRLSTRAKGGHRTEVAVTFHDFAKANLQFNFSTKSTTDALLDKPPTEFFADEAVFFPTKEMLTMFPGFTALYRNYSLQVDETYYDLCLALEKPLPKGPKLAEVRPMLTKVEGILHGSVELRDGRFYLKQDRGGDFEIPLVAEGFRKLGTLSYLLANGTLARQSVLFWDEPETNLNPAYMVKLAELLAAIARNGTQVFIATHSLFMVRELSLLLGRQENTEVDRRFFALALGEAESGTRISEGKSAEEIEPITSLDAELQQSERYLDTQMTQTPEQQKIQ